MIRRPPISTRTDTLCLHDALPISSSNFFSRLTHRHPGRVVWLVFNVMIALMLMEGGIQTVVERVLALYSNFAVAWFGAVTADLMISKPLGLSPKGIEFRRAHLYDINPVGVGAMALSLTGSTLSFMGLFGNLAGIYSPVIGLAISFGAAPLIAWATRGRYYRSEEHTSELQSLMRISYAVFCLKKKKNKINKTKQILHLE